jgi:nitrogen fixation protein NifU and related proteins
VNLYGEAIRAHARAPQRRRAVVKPTVRARRSNPLCGDVLDVTLLLRDDAVGDLGWTGSACMLGVASASIMAELVVGMSREEALAAAAALASYLESLSGVAASSPPRASPPPASPPPASPPPPSPPPRFPLFAAFAAVASFPVRRGCVELPWRALEDALTKAAQGTRTR